MTRMAGDSMSKILGSFNSANLGEVAHSGTIQNAKNEANTILNNFKAEDAVANMAYKADAADATRDYRSEVAGMEQDSARFGAITSGIGAIAGGAMRGSDFSLFGDKTDLSNVDVNSSAFKIGKQEGDSYYGSYI